MNIPQLTALCLRYHGVLLDASEVGGSCCGSRCTFA